MPILVIYEFVKRIFLPVILPLFLAAAVYLKGRYDGVSSCEESQREAKDKIERSIRKVEEENQEIQRQRQVDKSNNADRSLEQLVRLFNFKYGADRSPSTTKTDP